MAGLQERMDALRPGQVAAVRAWQDAGLGLREALDRVEDAETTSIYESLFGRGEGGSLGAAPVREAEAVVSDPYEALFGRAAR